MGLFEGAGVALLAQHHLALGVVHVGERLVELLVDGAQQVAIDVVGVVRHTLAPGAGRHAHGRVERGCGDAALFGAVPPFVGVVAGRGGTCGGAGHRAQRAVAQQGVHRGGGGALVRLGLAGLAVVFVEGGAAAAGDGAAVGVVLGVGAHTAHQVVGARRAQRALGSRGGVDVGVLHQPVAGVVVVFAVAVEPVDGLGALAGLVVSHLHAVHAGGQDGGCAALRGGPRGQAAAGHQEAVHAVVGVPVFLRALVAVHAVLVHAPHPAPVALRVVLVADVGAQVINELHPVQLVVADLGVLFVHPVAARHHPVHHGPANDPAVGLVGAVAHLVVAVLRPRPGDVVHRLLDVPVGVVLVADALATGAALRGQPARQVVGVGVDAPAQVGVRDRLPKQVHRVHRGLDRGGRGAGVRRVLLAARQGVAGGLLPAAHGHTARALEGGIPRVRHRGAAALGAGALGDAAQRVEVGLVGVQRGAVGRGRVADAVACGVVGVAVGGAFEVVCATYTRGALHLGEPVGRVVAVVGAAQQFVLGEALEPKDVVAVLHHAAIGVELLEHQGFSVALLIQLARRDATCQQHRLAVAVRIVPLNSSQTPTHPEWST